MILKTAIGSEFFHIELEPFPVNRDVNYLF